jgi:HAE1 family hydrophobic/amphiphilic exporter-1
VDITGPDLERLIALGGQIFAQVNEKIPDVQARPIPSLDLGNPEVQVIPHRRRAADLEVSNRELGFAVNALVDGVKVSDYHYEGRKIDLTLRGEDTYASRTHEIERIPIATSNGQLVPLGSVAQVTLTSGPTQINRIERQRAISIDVNPPETMALEAAMDTIQGEILAPMRDRGELSPPYHADMHGTADKLTQTALAFRWNILLALAITYLLMAALFESFLHPLVIMLSVPVAGLGGFLGLAAVNKFLTYQALDVLTMLGFIILIGTVVNNAILIVHQSLNYLRLENPLPPREAIREAVSNRIRPIFMSVTTSVCGMMPLVLFPGAGSELYRGLGSVVVGGLVVSTVFTLFLVPAMFSLSHDFVEGLAARFRAFLHRPEAATD